MLLSDTTAHYDDLSEDQLGASCSRATERSLPSPGRSATGVERAGPPPRPAPAVGEPSFGAGLLGDAVRRAMALHAPPAELLAARALFHLDV